MPGWRILPRARPGLGLPGLLGVLLPRGFLFFRRLMYPHGLRSTWPSRADRDDAIALLHDFPFRDYVATTCRLISQKVLGRLLMSDLLKGPDMIPFLKACTIISSSLVCSLATYAPNRLRKSFKDSPWYCLTSNRL